MLFVLAAVVRLAYFNVTEETRQQTTDENRKYNQGLPVTSVAIIIPMIFLLRRYFSAGFILIYEIALLCIGFLFILDIKIKKPDKRMTVILGILSLFVVVRLIMMGVGFY